MGQWVRVDDDWVFELTPTGRAILAEEERPKFSEMLMYEEMADQHFAEEERKARETRETARKDDQTDHSQFNSASARRYNHRQEQ